MTVRQATVEDARAIAEVHVEGWRWAYRGQVPDHFIDALSVDEREAMWRDALDAGRPISVAAARGRIVGFAAIGPSDDEQAQPGAGELHAIYLLQAYAGRGIGRMLLTNAEGSLRGSGYRRAILWVLESNERARRFYERAGWSWDGTVSTHRFDRAERPVVRYVRDL